MTRRRNLLCPRWGGSCPPRTFSGQCPPNWTNQTRPGCCSAAGRNCPNPTLRSHYTRALSGERRWVDATVAPTATSPTWLPANFRSATTIQANRTCPGPSACRRHSPPPPLAPPRCCAARSRTCLRPEGRLLPAWSGPAAQSPSSPGPTPGLLGLLLDSLIKTTVTMEKIVLLIFFWSRNFRVYWPHIAKAVNYILPLIALHVKNLKKLLFHLKILNFWPLQSEKK